MLPTIAQPLASIAGGAALPTAPGGAPAPSATLPSDAIDAAKKPARAAAATAARASRPRAGAAGYASAPRAARSSPESAAASSAKAAAAAGKTAGPLGFLEDRNLSVEEKLMRLLAYLSDKWDKDLEKKMKEIESGQQKTAAGGAPAQKKSGGLLGSLGAAVKAASTFFPVLGVAMEALKNPTVRAALSKVGGPVLAAAATALGYPALAPVLLKYGPAIVDVAGNVATSLDAGHGASGGSAASAPATSPSATGMNDSELRLKLMEIERIQNLQKEMFSLVSNILRAGHETRMNVIQNVR